MAKTTKKSKTGTSKSKKVLGLVVFIMALFVAGYFVYFAGIIPQILTGMTITETKADGSTGNVAKLNLLETNYYYMSVYSMYAQYGIVSEDTLDTVFNKESGQTYREYFLAQGADQAMELILMEREADSKGFREISGAGKCARKEIDSLRGIAKLYNYGTVERYLSQQFGTGMSSRLYKKCLERGFYSDEYQAYISQFDTSIAPTDDAIREQYKADPSAFDTVDFNYYLVTGKTDSNGKVDIEGAKKTAQWIMAKASDAKSFRDAVKLYLTESKDDEALKEYEDEDNDPTAITSLGKNEVRTYYDDKLADFLFASDRKIGDKTVLESASGAYVVLLTAKKLDEEKNVTFRTLTLSNEAKNGKVRTDEEVAADAQKLVEKANQIAPQGLDPLSFYKLVKAHSDDQDEILSGGYDAGETKEEMLETEDGKEADAETKALAEWLFDDARKTGDVMVSTSADKKTVVIYYFEKATPSWIAKARDTQTTNNVSKLKENLKKTNNPQYAINSDLMKKFIYT